MELKKIIMELNKKIKELEAEAKGLMESLDEDDVIKGEIIIETLESLFPPRKNKNRNYKIKRENGLLVAYDRKDKEKSYGVINIRTGNFKGDTRCFHELQESLEEFRKKNHDDKTPSKPLTSGREFLTENYGEFSNGKGIPKMLDRYVEHLLETKQVFKK